MTTVYIIRHAEAEGNIHRIFHGHSDGHLSEIGIRQTQCLYGRFSTIKLDAVYSSPLTRAYNTALAVRGSKNLEIIKLDDLMEIDAGGFEGLAFEDLYKLYPEQMQAWDNHPYDFVAPNGESIVQVHDRMTKAIDDIVRQNRGKTVAVVSHGCAIRSYICGPLGLGIQRVGEAPWCNNTGVTTLIFGDNAGVAVETSGDISHLPEELKGLSKRKWWDFRDPDAALVAQSGKEDAEKKTPASAGVS